MTAISSAGLSFIDRTGASRAASAARTSTPTNRQSASVDASTHVHLGQGAANHAVYLDPRSTSGSVRLWSSKVSADDDVSALMARNRGLHSYALGDQWRGLGGALLTRFGKTGEDYSQTLVDDTTSGADNDLSALSPEERAHRTAEILAAQAAEVAGFASNAPSAGLTIRTRSGQSVELKISVGAGVNGVFGMKTELKASGPMSGTERAAIEQLAAGLDRALEGLGRDDALDLDVSGLTNYDRGAISSIDLSANNTQSNEALGSFALHLGDDKQSVALKGSDGEIHLSVDPGASLSDASAQQRGAATQRMLDRIDAAGDRGQVNAALIRQMKSAFSEFQSAADASDGAGIRPPVNADVVSQLSGLADFDANFGGETSRANRFGTTNEAGRAEYHLSQKTTANDVGGKAQSVAQTVSEQLSADYRKAPGDGMLDVSTGNYIATHVRDDSTVTTLIESAADRVDRVLRKTDVEQLKTVNTFENHRLTQRQSSPSQRSVVERLE